jgi:hypothetical protein
MRRQGRRGSSLVRRLCGRPPPLTLRVRSPVLHTTLPCCLYPCWRPLRDAPPSHPRPCPCPRPSARPPVQLRQVGAGSGRCCWRRPASKCPGGGVLLRVSLAGAGQDTTAWGRCDGPGNSSAPTSTSRAARTACPRCVRSASGQLLNATQLARNARNPVHSRRPEPPGLTTLGRQPICLEILTWRRHGGHAPYTPSTSAGPAHRLRRVCRRGLQNCDGVSAVGLDGNAKSGASSLYDEGWGVLALLHVAGHAGGRGARVHRPGRLHLGGRAGRRAWPIGAQQQQLVRRCAPHVKL